MSRHEYSALVKDWESARDALARAKLPIPSEEQIALIPGWQKPTLTFGEIQAGAAWLVNNNNGQEEPKDRDQQTRLLVRYLVPRHALAAIDAEGGPKTAGGDSTANALREQFNQAHFPVFNRLNAFLEGRRLAYKKGQADVLTILAAATDKLEELSPPILFFIAGALMDDADRSGVIAASLEQGDDFACALASLVALQKMDAASARDKMESVAAAGVILLPSTDPLTLRYNKRVLREAAETANAAAAAAAAPEPSGGGIGPGFQTLRAYTATRSNRHNPDAMAIVARAAGVTVQGGSVILPVTDLGNNQFGVDFSTPNWKLEDLNSKSEYLYAAFMNLTAQVAKVFRRLRAMGRDLSDARRRGIRGAGTDHEDVPPVEAFIGLHTIPTVEGGHVFSEHPAIPQPGGGYINPFLAASPLAPPGWRGQRGWRDNRQARNQGNNPFNYMLQNQHQHQHQHHQHQLAPPAQPPQQLQHQHQQQPEQQPAPFSA